MALKDTLVRLKRQQDDAMSFDAGKQELRDEWVAAVGDVIEDFKTFLSPFESDGALALRERELVLSEEALGTYSARAATIDAGPARIEITPVARIVVGALGRIDLSRQGFPKSSNRILMLRHQKVDEEKQWYLRMPVETAGVWEIGGLTRQVDARYVSFDRGNVEKSIEFLLNL